jgi:tRNA(Ile)-lysidine synthase
MEHRPGLDPAVAEIRRAVRECLAGIDGPVWSAFPAGRIRSPRGGRRVRGAEGGVRSSATVIDHGLQSGSAQVAARAASTAEQLGLPTRVIAVQVAAPAGGGGPESAARDARRAALLARRGTWGHRGPAGPPSTTRPRRCSSASPADRAPRASAGCRPIAGRRRILRPLLDVRRATAPPAPRGPPRLGRPAQPRPPVPPGARPPGRHARARGRTRPRRRRGPRSHERSAAARMPRPSPR